MLPEPVRNFWNFTFPFDSKLWFAIVGIFVFYVMLMAFLWDQHWKQFYQQQQEHEQQKPSDETAATNLGIAKHGLTKKAIVMKKTKSRREDFDLVHALWQVKNALQRESC